MTDTAPTTPATRTSTRWLYPALAVTGIAVGIFVIVAGTYLLFVHSGSGHSAKADCCTSMEADAKKKMDDPKMPMNKPSMSPMPSTSPMPPAPAPTP